MFVVESRSTFLVTDQSGKPNWSCLMRI